MLQAAFGWRSVRAEDLDEMCMLSAESFQCVGPRLLSCSVSLSASCVVFPPSKHNVYGVSGVLVKAVDFSWQTPH